MKELASLNKYFLKYRWRILAGILCVVSANFLNAYTPKITGEAVNLISDTLKSVSASTSISPELRNSVAWMVFMLFLKYLGVALLAGTFTFMMRQSIIVVSRLIEYDLKNDIYDHYQRLDLAFYRKNNTGDLMSRITEDVSRVRMYIGPAIMYAVNLLFTIVFAVSFMLQIDATLTFYVLIPLPVLSVIIYLVNEKIEKASTHIQAKLSDLTTNAQETYSGIRVVQAYNREKEMLMHFSSETEEYKDKQLKLARIDSIYFPVMTFLVGVSIVIVVYLGGIHVGNKLIKAGDLVSFIGYVNMLMWPVSSLGWTASLIQRAAASQKRINEFLSRKPALQNGAVKDFQVKGDLVFRKVSFTYPDTGIQALRDISFSIKNGQRIAIIGRTGSGKTTIADLLMRMYDVSEGEILLDGKNISEYDLQSLRRQIGFVPQDVFLFSETITENINFGMNESSKEKAVEYAQLASIASEIERFPAGFDTLVGERGVTLSGGQKQRISIARALIKHPRILILDDSLSAVDASTEKQIQQNLDKLLSGKTAIIITHRIFSLIHFDNILVVDDGTILEQGTHEELLARKGVYQEIYNRQMSESNEAVNIVGF
ncbi:MAG: ABC transporter ATP-binding protein [Bacteroidetes bacterium]|nr:ABC transporter ATP-binding protein [Bacteroidota bacterium]